MSGAVEDCTDPACFICEQTRLAQLRSGLSLLARNLRDAAGCALASDLRNLTIGEFGDDIESAWHSNCDGRPAPGWER